MLEGRGLVVLVLLLEEAGGLKEKFGFSRPNLVGESVVEKE